MRQAPSKAGSSVLAKALRTASCSGFVRAPLRSCAATALSSAPCAEKRDAASLTWCPGSSPLRLVGGVHLGASDASYANNRL